MMRTDGTDKDRPLYMISVAAELAGMHPQTLRIYERKQLIQPKRSAGNTRLYSDADIERLRLIQQLTQEEGVNLAGVDPHHRADGRARARAARRGGARSGRGGARDAPPRSRRPSAIRAQLQGRDRARARGGLSRRQEVE